MRFELNTAKSFYDSDDTDVQELKEYGVIFRPSTIDERLYLDESGEIEINTLEEIMAFIERWGSIILEKEMIWIYNDYME